MKNSLKLLLLILVITRCISAQSITEVLLPKYMEGVQPTNIDRIPCAYRLTITGLTPNATYRYINQFVISSDAQTTNGAGNVIIVKTDGSDFLRTSSPSLSSNNTYGTFTAGSDGTYTGWFVTEPTGNSSRMIPGQYVHMRIAINDGANGTTAALRLTTPDSIKVLKAGITATDTAGTVLTGFTSSNAKNFAVLYDNIYGTGRPVSATFIENDGTANTTSNSYTSAYASSVDGVKGAFGTIIPNILPNGIRRIEIRSLTTGEIVSSAIAPDGVWPGGISTLNPAGGKTALSFNVPDAAKPSLPVLITPSNRATDQSLNTTLKWASVSNATSVRLQIASDSLFTNLIYNDSTLTDTLKQTPNLQNNTKYYWRVQGVNVNVNGDWSSVWNFTTAIAAPNAPSLLLPADNAQKQQVSLTLNWNSAAQAESYRLQVAKDKNFTDLIINDSTLTATAKQITGLGDGVKYYWRVNANNKAVASLYSETRSFTTLLNSPEKAEAAALADKIIRLTWTDKSGSETGFLIERKLTSGSEFKVIDSVASGITSYKDTTLTNGTSYTYRVKAHNLVAESDYSNEATAKTTTLVNGFNNAVPTEFALYQNFPNPFNPTTVISYSIPQQSHVELKIFDMLGHEVSTLVSKEQAAGNYKLEFNGSALPSGIYVYTIQCGQFRNSKKLLLMK